VEDGGVGREIEQAGRPIEVGVAVPKRGRPVSGQAACAHQRQACLLVERVQRDELRPDVHGGIEPSMLFESCRLGAKQSDHPVME
jgi:hypothetical protein